jgi:hypothetical protein
VIRPAGEILFAIGYGSANIRSVSHRTLQRSYRVVLLAALAVLWWPNSAFAYLDPASSSMLLQLILGGAAGVAVAFKLFWRRLVGLLSRRESDKPEG